MLIRPWQDQFGFNLEKEVGNILSECIEIKQLLLTYHAYSHQTNLLAESALLDNSLLSIQNKIQYQLSILNQFEFTHKAAHLNLEKLSETIELEIKKSHMGLLLQDPHKICVELIKTIQHWQKTSLKEFKKSYIEPYYREQKKISHEDCAALRQNAALIKIIKATMNEYNFYLHSKYPNKPLKRNIAFKKIFKNIGVINNNGDPVLPKDYKQLNHSTNELRRMINLIFSNSKKSILHSSGTASKLLILNIQKNHIHTKLCLKKTLLGKYKTSLIINHENIKLNLSSDFSSHRKKLKDNATKSRNSLKTDLSTFRLKLSNLKHSLQTQQRKISLRYLKQFEALTHENQHYLSQYYPTPFRLKRVNTVLESHPVREFDRLCSGYFIKIKEIIYKLSYWNNNKNINVIYQNSNAQVLFPIFVPFLNFFSQRNQFNISQSNGVASSQSANDDIKNNSVGLILLKRLILDQYRLLILDKNYTTNQEASTLMKYLYDFLSSPIYKNERYTKDFDNFYKQVMANHQTPGSPDLAKVKSPRRHTLSF